MRVVMKYGLARVEFEVAEGERFAALRAPEALPNPAEAVRAALETPHGFPALRRALTADDHVAVVVDEELARPAELLIPVLEHVANAGVAPENITLVCAPSSSRQPWLEDLPEAFEDVRLEIHDPTDRKRLSYLATMGGGRRLYLNRSIVDADQLVVLSGCRYDPVLGRGGAEGAVYPALSDEATRKELYGRVHLAGPDDADETLAEAMEAAWLLGAPFFVLAVEGSGDAVAHVMAGAADAAEEARRLLDAAWRRPVPERADLVVAGLSGDPSRHTFADLAAAAACAARVVQPDGRIVLLSQVGAGPGPGADVLRQGDDPQAALAQLRREPTVERLPALRWAEAASRARLYLLSALEDELVEDLFATPLQQAAQVQRLLDAADSCVFLDDAHRVLAVVDETAGVRDD